MQPTLLPLSYGFLSYSFRKIIQPAAGLVFDVGKNGSQIFELTLLFKKNPVALFTFPSPQTPPWENPKVSSIKHDLGKKHVKFNRKGTNHPDVHWRKKIPPKLATHDSCHFVRGDTRDNDISHWFTEEHQLSYLNKASHCHMAKTARIPNKPIKNDLPNRSFLAFMLIPVDHNHKKNPTNSKFLVYLRSSFQGKQEWKWPLPSVRFHASTSTETCFNPKNSKVKFASTKLPKNPTDCVCVCVFSSPETSSPNLGRSPSKTARWPRCFKNKTQSVAIFWKNLHKELIGMNVVEKRISTKSGRRCTHLFTQKNKKTIPSLKLTGHSPWK